MADGDEGSRWGVASLQRRRHPRINVSLPVEITGRRGAGGSPAPRQAALRTLGGGGLLLIAPEPMQVGDALDLTLHLPAAPADAETAAGWKPGPSLRIEAVVVWTDIATEGLADECRCGVAFTAIRDADRAAILEFIARARRE